MPLQNKDHENIGEFEAFRDGYVEGARRGSKGRVGCYCDAWYEMIAKTFILPDGVPVSVFNELIQYFCKMWATFRALHA